MLVNAMIHDQQRTFCREHADAQIGIFRDPLAPDPGSVHHHRRMQGLHLAGEMISNVHPADGCTFTNQPGHFMGRQNDRAMLSGIQHVGSG
ncbi:hypothetical protein D3C73_1486100 [compost metagenome]